MSFKGVDPELPSYEAGLRDYEAEHLLSDNHEQLFADDEERVVLEFEMEDPIAEEMVAEESFLSKYHRFFEGFRYPWWVRGFILSWYTVNLFFFAIVIFYSQTTFANYTLSSQRPKEAWSSVARSIVHSLETIAPGSTKDISVDLMDDIPLVNSTYNVYHFGICKETENLDIFCSKGDAIAKYLLKDLAVQMGSKEKATDEEAALESAIKAASIVVDQHTICEKRHLLNFFDRKCIVKDIDAQALSTFKGLEATSEQRVGRRLWVAVFVSFLLVFSLDVLGWLYLNNEVVLSIPWGLCFASNFFIRAAYVIWTSSYIPKMAVFDDVEVYFYIGSLYEVAGLSLGLQVALGLMIFFLWTMRVEEKLKSEAERKKALAKDEEEELYTEGASHTS